MRSVGSERSLGLEHPKTLENVHSLATLLCKKGDLSSAATLYHRACEARERVLGPEHPETLDSIGSLASLFLNKGDLAAAEPLHRRTVSVGVQVLGEDHPLVLNLWNNLVLTIILLSKCDEARGILSRNAQTKAPPHENLTPRIPLLQWVVEALAGRVAETAILLGGLKAHFSDEPLPIFGGIQVPWDLAYFIKTLEPKLGPQNTELLRALVAVLNARCTVPPSPDLPTLLAALDAFPAWREAVPLPLE